MTERRAVIYRMVLPDHICPFGVRALQLLETSGFAVEDKILATRTAVDAFKAEQGVSTTPMVFIGGERIGGSRELADYLASTESAA